MTEKGKIMKFFRSKKSQWKLLLAAVLIYALFYIPVPYFITMPGSAVELNTIIEVEDGNQQSGEFMFTTVSMIQASFPSLIYSKFNSYMETIPEEYILDENESQEDYANRQLKVMKQSQDDAIISAFNYLNVPIEIKEKGIIVMGLTPDTPSKEVLKVGDLIVQVDNLPMKKVEDLLDYLKSKQAGEIIEVVFVRDNKTYTEEIPLISLSQNENSTSDRIGIGFYPYNEREVIPSKEVIFKTDEIGGPSAGLMFALEIINQLSAEDLTRGYEIAGTGTIDSNGVVGQIGGARLKVKAAYEKGVDIFFVPKDIYQGDTNQFDAKQANKDLGKPMEVVPVANLEEAIEYLNSLPKKTAPN